uniref:Uncharacterized protein n=1 Tax=Arundo donax TaxID=35708 RepID=A0A0A8XSN8_ARUDO
MRILMNVRKQHKTYAIPQPFIFTEMEKGLMRCLVQEKRDYMIDYGCIRDGSGSHGVDKPHMLLNILTFLLVYFWECKVLSNSTIWRAVYICCSWPYLLYGSHNLALPV